MSRKLLLVLSVLVLAGAIAVASPASAGVTTNERYSFSTSSVTCSGEVVAFEIDVHLLSRFSWDAQGVPHSGGVLTASYRGTSASGAKYLGQSTGAVAIRGTPGADTTSTSTSHFNLMRLGEDGTADDRRAHSIFHFTLNASGELVSSKVDVVFECA